MDSSVGGRRGVVSLGGILRFATGAEVEPLLGFAIHPIIEFIKTGKPNSLPTSNTCINRLNLPRATLEYSLPEENKLFDLYDYAFSSDYFGLK